MSDLLVNPGVQAGVIPFILAFVVAAILNRTGDWAGIGILIGFVVLLLLTTGIQFDPLTSTRKIVLLTLIAGLVAIVLSVLKAASSKYRNVFLVAAIASMLWVLWPYLMRQETMDAIIVGAGLGLFVAWMFVAFVSQNNISIYASSASIAAAGFGIGGAALLGASALLGQMGIAIGSAAFGILLAAVATKRSGNAGYIAVTVAGMSLGLIAGAATIYAKLPWYTLFAFMPIPVLARIGLSNDQGPLLRSGIWFGICMVPSLLAIFLSWNAAGPVSGY